MHVVSPVIESESRVRSRPRPERIEENPKAAATRTIRQFNDQQRALLRERLSTVPPKRFEHLVGELLDAMG